MEEWRRKRKKWEPLVKALTLCNPSLLLFQFASHSALQCITALHDHPLRFTLLCFSTCTAPLSEYVPVKKYAKLILCLNYRFLGAKGFLTPGHLVTFSDLNFLLSLDLHRAFIGHEMLFCERNNIYPLCTLLDIISSLSGILKVCLDTYVSN